MGPVRTLLLSLALVPALAAPASAATFASPSPGAGADCSQANPCDLPTALSQAGGQPDRTAIALPGTYTLGATVSVPDGVTLRGPGADLVGAAGQDALSTAAGTVEQIVADAPGPGGSALHVTGAAIVSDTVARAANGADAVLIGGTGGGVLTNLTAYAAGGGAAVHVALGTLAASTFGSSLVAGPVQDDTLGVGAPSFDAYSDHGAFDPQFVNAPGDLRLAKGSPAVDAADPADSGSGRGDADGLPRQYGARVDLGAYELTPPAVANAPVSDVTSTSATFNGSIVPNARGTQYSLLYGTSPASLASLPGTAVGAGTAAVPISKAITGLTPGTTYYLSLVAASSAGATASQPITFATLPAPPPAKPARKAATILLVGSRSVRADGRRRWRVPVQCPKAEPYPCQGVLAVRSVKALRFGTSTKRIVFGSLRFVIPAGRTVLLGPVLTKARLNLVRRNRSVAVTVSAITQGATVDDQRYFARRFTLLPPR